MDINSLKVLICDDSLLILKKLGENLKELGCKNILEAFDGQEAIDLYKSNNPDLVFMDMIMPKKSGIEAVKEIVEFDEFAKIIILSTVGTKANLKRAIDSGAYDFIQKPFEKQQIKGALENFIKGRSS